MTVDVRGQHALVLSESSTLGTGMEGRYFLSSDPDWSVSTIMRALLEAPWRSQVLDQVLLLAEISPIGNETLNSAAHWLLNLPPSMPRPAIGVGDDGTISVEGDRRGNTLHVMFEEGNAEVYFAGANGDEWETNLGQAPDKLDMAMRTIASSQ